MKAIVTHQNEDGTFDDVGTNNRFVTKQYKTERNLIKFNRNPKFPRKVRFEFYRSCIIREDKPYKTVID